MGCAVRAGRGTQSGLRETLGIRTCSGLPTDSWARDPQQAVHVRLGTGPTPGCARLLGAGPTAGRGLSGTYISYSAARLQAGGSVKDKSASTITFRVSLGLSEKRAHPGHSASSRPRSAAEHGDDSAGKARRGGPAGLGAECVTLTWEPVSRGTARAGGDPSGLRPDPPPHSLLTAEAEGLLFQSMRDPGSPRLLSRAWPGRVPGRRP